MSILLYNFQELTKCMKEVEGMEAKINSIMEKEKIPEIQEEAEKEEIPITLDGFLMKKNDEI
jgi:hypothetical protein